MLPSCNTTFYGPPEHTSRGASGASLGRGLVGHCTCGQPLNPPMQATAYCGFIRRCSSDCCDFDERRLPYRGSLTVSSLPDCLASTVSRNVISCAHLLRLATFITSSRARISLQVSSMLRHVAASVHATSVYITTDAETADGLASAIKVTLPAVLTNSLLLNVGVRACVCVLLE